MLYRIQTLDIAKLIGLVLVCFCHIPLPEGNFHIWAYSFHMPLFFILSGMFFRAERFVWSKSVFQLLVPFVLYNVLAWGIAVGIGYVSTHHLSLPHMSLTDLLMSNYIVGPSWFLLSLFMIRGFTYMVWQFSVRVFDKSVMKDWMIISVPVGLLLVYILTENWGGWQVLSLRSTILGWLFYLFGYFAKDYILQFVQAKKRIWLILALVSLLVSFFSISNGQVGIHCGEYGNHLLLFFFFGIAGTAGILGLSRLIKLPTIILDTFMQGALFYICMHTLMFEYMLLVWNKLTGDFSGNTLSEKIVVTLLTFIVSYPIIKLVLRYTPVLVGKSNQR